MKHSSTLRSDQRLVLTACAELGARIADSAPSSPGMALSATSITFDFASDRSADASPDHTSAHDEFRGDFLREMHRLDQWSAENHWSPRDVADLKVRISADYRISKSLVPSWYGETGHMRFPVSRVAARRAAIMHELVHVYFPSGNRLLAEGLAVYLQAVIGGNSAFPNFGRPLHALSALRLQEIAGEAEDVPAPPAGAGHLAKLDAIPTPNPLTLAAGSKRYGEDARGQGVLYPLAGSFVQFLIETRGLVMFRLLYSLTPFVPLTLNGGVPLRWTEVYGMSLATLESEWSALLHEQAISTDPPHVSQ